MLSKSWFKRLLSLAARKITFLLITKIVIKQKIQPSKITKARNIKKGGRRSKIIETKSRLN